MADTATAPSDQALEDARWALEPLVEGGGRKRATELLAEAARLGEEFSARYRGAVADLDPPALAGASPWLKASTPDLMGPRYWPSMISAKPMIAFSGVLISWTNSRSES